MRPVTSWADRNGRPRATSASATGETGFVAGIDGPPLMETFQKQAERFGTEMIGEDVVSVDLRARPFRVACSDTTLEGHTVILATGASAKLLGLENEAKHGKGKGYAPTSVNRTTATLRRAAGWIQKQRPSTFSESPGPRIRARKVRK